MEGTGVLSVAKANFSSFRRMPSLDVKASTDDNWSPVAIHQMWAKLMPTRRFVLVVDTMKPACEIAAPPTDSSLILFPRTG